MSKIVSVSQLKSGDKFAFLNGPSSGASSPLNEESKMVYVVTRPPAVNLAANTCFFRYQPADMSEADVAHGAASRSFNGLPELKVAIPGAEPDQPAAAATKSSAVKLAGQTDLSPPAKHVTKPAAQETTSKAATPTKAEAPPTAAAKATMRPSTAKRAVDFLSSEPVEPRQEGAILPSLTKASKSEPAVQNGAVQNGATNGAAKPTAKKSVEKQVVEKRSAAKKPVKKAAPKKSAAKTAKKK
jgi:hypothetical protein